MATPSLGIFSADRADLVKRLREAMLNHQNVVLIGPRRYGKSSAIREAQGKAKRQGARVAFVNVANCHTREDVVEILANAIMRDGARKRLLDRAIRVATEAHERQVDMSGKPRIQHPLRVMRGWDTWARRP